ncbi:MBL fold metallo-hydrolase [Lysobacter solisilvae (ex Woo and Kim 2020)]|uniref:MBL fold metallo-hydrolase n=1 Tax=Agrilutibacter terrestris TaxID=2865112 RepID=A0A7H0G095_9GAMM|nr:MBL fold metallo-hydrolase [Lysobacter terrestris]QNP41711.1 MBL fold metallo-hydrolase [Lysobacter terrestris]
MPRRPRFRRLRRLALFSGVLTVTACLLSAAHTNAPLAAYADSPQSERGVFRNPVPKPADGLLKTLGIVWNVLLNKPADAVPAAAPPVLALTRAQLEAAPDRSLFRLGHSTMLIKLRGGFWITDPVFAERASPVQWLGPKRFHAPPIALEDLPPLRGVILSHDHYDHLDRDTVRRLARTTEVFLTPLGVGDRLVAWGVDPAKVYQFDWWQGATIDGVRFTATPAQHFSGRGLFDGNKTLWASWVIVDNAHADATPGDAADADGLRVFFSGDTGYFDGFKEIGRRFGPFDVTLMETGAYDPQWPYVHMQPEQTVQAHQDLRGRWLLPMHNGTFDLAMHGWTEPFERVSALAAQRGIALTTPRMGERLDLAAPHAATPWWRGVDAVVDTRVALANAGAAR